LSSLSTHLPWGRKTQILEIHSKKDQGQRSRASQQFRESTAPYSILVTSDVSARGVDYPGVSRVIQVGVPGSRDLYIHRVGRTGRAGKPGRGDLVVQDFERDFVKTTLGDLKLVRYEVATAAAETKTLAEAWDENPPPVPVAAEVSSPSSKRRDKRFGSSSSPSAGAPPAPVVPRLETLETSLRTNVLPSMDEFSIRETFASLLGYYVPKSSELRTSPMDVVKGLQDWAMIGWGLEQKPFVSDAMMKKMGAGSSSRGGDRGGRGGFGGGGRGGGRGGFGGRSDRGESRSFGGRSDRGESKNYGDRPEKRDYGDRPERSERRDYGDRPERSERKPYGERSSGFGGDRPERSERREERKPSFGFGGKSSLYGSNDADAWEKPSQGRGRRSFD
ncbi:hypothetical protein P7C70_g7489, partial [Phenoliferia sp. Uapishka_3]